MKVMLILCWIHFGVGVFWLCRGLGILAMDSLARRRYKALTGRPYEGPPIKSPLYAFLIALCMFAAALIFKF